MGVISTLACLVGAHVLILSHFFLTKSSFKKINKAHLRLPTAAIMWPSLVAQTVKHLPTMWETQVQALGQEDLEKEKATHSSILAWKIPWTEEPRRLQSMGSQRVGHD